MMRSFQKYQKNFVFVLLIVAIVFVMAMYGINQSNHEGGGAGGAAAWVNGEPITNREFAQMLESRVEEFRARLGDQMDERFLNQFQIPQRTLEELVQYKLLVQNARNLGFRVTDLELRNYIQKAPNFQKDGHFDPELYRRVPNRGLEEKRMRESMLMRRMQMYLAGRIDVPPTMLDREYELKETKVNLSYARIDPKALAAKGVSVSKEEAEAFLKNTPPDQLKNYYDSHARDFSSPGAVQLRQIRIGLPFQASAEKKAEAKKKIEAIAKEVTSENFEAMARKHSDDEHAKKGGNVGWVNRGTLERAMEDAITKLQPKEVSPPVETAFGYYLLQVKENRPESAKPFETVKTDIAKEMLKAKKAEEFSTKRKAEWDKKLAEGKSIDADLKAAGIEVKKTGPFSVGQGYIPQIGQADEILDAVFTLSKAKPQGSKLFASGTDLYFIRLESVEPPKKGEYDVDRQSAAAGVTTALQTTLITKWVEKLQADSAVRIEAKFDSKEENPFSLQ